LENKKKIRFKCIDCRVQWIEYKTRAEED